MTSALEDIVVVDTSATMAGTMASSFLADFGADVVLVEPPAGTPLRAQPAWPFWGRGKRSVVLDLTTPSGRDELADLGRAADVVIETWRPGVAERLGFGDADLRPFNPGLVYASVTGFGRDNPLSGLKAYEPVVMAKIGGLSSFANLSRRKGPSFVSTPYCIVQRCAPRAPRDPRRADRAGVERCSVSGSTPRSCRVWPPTTPGTGCSRCSSAATTRRTPPRPSGTRTGWPPTWQS